MLHALATLRLVDGPVAAHALVEHILRLGLEERAERHVVGEDGNVAPRRRVPVWIVVALLRALEPAPVPVWVLPRVDRADAVAVEVLVGRVEPLVARARLAVFVPREVFVDAILLVLVAGLRVGHAVGRASVAQRGRRVVAHVLQDNVAADILLGVSAAVLVGPLDCESRAFVVVHLALSRAGRTLVVLVGGIRADRLAVVAHLIAARRIVLRVKEPVLIASIVGDFVQLITGASRVVHVEVTCDPLCDESEQQQRRAHLERPWMAPKLQTLFVDVANRASHFTQMVVSKSLALDEMPRNGAGVQPP